MHKHDLLMHKRWFRVISWFALTVLMTFSVYLVHQNATVLRTSLIPSATHRPFDGTVYPIQKAPRWSALTTEEYKAVYSMIPSSKLDDTPYYNPNDFRTSFDTLVWGDPATEDIRNAKITYSVPYMGDYTLDSTEYSGSHLALDIKIPKGTPVFAIGNAIVVKVSNQSSGFGKHVVLEHNNFPTIDDEGQFTTYYSSYSHLDSILVSEGQVVDKGDQIALSGESGTATTPHLHFQIDNENADWHPYWPFTWQEASDAGLDFFSAVNAGLGKDRAMATTINPMMYVQKYLDPSANVVASASYVVAEVADVPEVAEPVVVEPVVVEPVEPVEVEEPYEEKPYEPTTSAEPAATSVSFEVVSRAAYEEGVTAYLTVYVKDESGNTYTGNFDGLLKLSLNNEIGEIEKDRLSYDDFEDGKIKLAIKDLTEGKAKLKVTYGQDVFYSDWFEVNEKEEENATASVVSAFSDVPADHENYEAITYLAENGVIKGYPDGTFKPDATVTRAEALKFVLEGISANSEIADLDFNDVVENDWFYKYVSTASMRSIVAGYPDGSFKPVNTVNRAEFLKILFTAIDADVPSKVSKDPFKDVSKDTWFAPYFKYAKDNDILDFNQLAWPTQGMERAHVAEAMFRVMSR